MKSRFLAFFLVLMLIFSLVPVVGAQDMPCYNLSADDCALLQAAEAKSSEIASFNMSYTLNFSADLSSLAAMGLMADPAEGQITVNSTGSGPLAVDMNAENPLNALKMALDLTGSVVGGGSNESGELSFVIVDGVFYAKDPSSGNWMGLPLETLFAQAGLPVDLNSLLQGGDPTAMLGNTAGMGDMGDMDMSAYISQVRLADENMMGQTMYAFQTTVDVGAFLNSAEFQQQLNTALQAAGSSDPNVAMAGAMVPMLLAGSSANINVTQWVGADDGFMHRLGVNFEASVDLGALMSAAGGGSNAPSMEPITINMDFTIDLADINAPVNVTAPEGATVQG